MDRLYLQKIMRVRGYGALPLCASYPHIFCRTCRLIIYTNIVPVREYLNGRHVFRTLLSEHWQQNRFSSAGSKYPIQEGLNGRHVLRALLSEHGRVDCIGKNDQL